MRFDSDDQFYYLLFRKYDSRNLPLFWKVVFFFTSGPNEEFGHVDLIASCGDDKTIVVVCAPWAMDIELKDVPIDDYLGLLKKSEESKACVEMKSAKSSDNFLPRGAITCVSVAKALMGIRGFLAITPYQLFKKLKKTGGNVLWER